MENRSVPLKVMRLKEIKGLTMVALSFLAQEIYFFDFIFYFCVINGMNLSVIMKLNFRFDREII